MRVIFRDGPPWWAWLIAVASLITAVSLTGKRSQRWNPPANRTERSRLAPSERWRPGLDDGNVRVERLLPVPMDDLQFTFKAEPTERVAAGALPDRVLWAWQQRCQARTDQAFSAGLLAATGTRG